MLIDLPWVYHRWQQTSSVWKSRKAQSIRFTFCSYCRFCHGCSDGSNNPKWCKWLYLSGQCSIFELLPRLLISLIVQLDTVVLCLLALITASVVTSMLVAMLNSTFLLIAVYKYDCFEPSYPFADYWARYTNVRCVLNLPVGWSNFFMNLYDFSLVLTYSYPLLCV